MASNKPEVNNYHFKIAEYSNGEYCGIIFKDNLQLTRTSLYKKHSDAEIEATALIRKIIFEVRNPNENKDSEIIYQVEGTELKYTVDNNKIPYPYGNTSIGTSEMKLILSDWEKRLYKETYEENLTATFHFEVYRIKTDKENNVLDSELIIKNAEIKAEPKTSKIKIAISDYLIKMKIANLPLHISTNENFTEYYVNDNNEKPIYDFIIK